MKIRDDYLAFGTPDFTDAEIDAVTRVMRSGWVGTLYPEECRTAKELKDDCVSPTRLLDSCLSK